MTETERLINTLSSNYADGFEKESARKKLEFIKEQIDGAIEMYTKPNKETLNKWAEIAD